MTISKEEAKGYMEGTQEDGSVKVRNAIAMVEEEGSRYFVVDQDLRKGDRRGDGQLMADFFRVDGSERLKKQRLLYDPSHGIIRQRVRVQKSEEALDVLNVMNDNAATAIEEAVISLEKGRRISQEGNTKGKSEGIKKSRGKSNAASIVVQEQ